MIHRTLWAVAAATPFQTAIRFVSGGVGPERKETTFVRETRVFNDPTYRESFDARDLLTERKVGIVRCAGWIDMEAFTSRCIEVLVADMVSAHTPARPPLPIPRPTLR